MALPDFATAWSQVVKPRAIKRAPQRRAKPSPRRVVAFDLAANVAAVDAVELPTRANLGLQLEPQQKSNWCWAAVALSIARQFGGGQVQSQCQLATLITGQPCCPANPATPIAFDDPIGNIPFELPPVLQQVGFSTPVTEGWRNMAVARELVRSTIGGRGRPLAVKVFWSDRSSAHYVVIDAYIDDETVNADQIVSVVDPLYGRRPPMTLFDFVWVYPHPHDNSVTAEWFEAYHV